MKFILICYSLISFFFLIGCSDDSNAQGENNTPGNSAAHFFDTLYNQQDLDKASTMATPRLARIMKSYGTPKQFARNLLNMQYDDVTIEVDITNISLREQYDDHTTISLIFSGHFNGQKINDYRRISMQKKMGRWYVDKINSDPFSR